MIISLGTAVANHLKKSIVIHLCQILKVDQLDEKDIREISDKTVYNWEWMIKKSRELSETKVDVANTRYKIGNNNPVGVLERICREMAMEKKILNPIGKV